MYNYDTLLAEVQKWKAEAERQKTRSDVILYAVMAAGGAGAKPKAIIDAVNRVLIAGDWGRDKGGRFSLLGIDGQPDKDAGGNHTTIESVVEGSRKEAPHLWPEVEEGAQSAPASHGSPAPTERQVPRYPRMPEPADGDNPWMEKSTNLEKRIEIMNTDPDRALRLARAAGKPIKFGMKVGEPLT